MKEKMELAFQEALLKQDFSTVSRLIAEGVNVNSELKCEELVGKDTYVTPLHIAVSKRTKEKKIINFWKKEEDSPSWDKEQLQIHHQR